LIRQFRNWWPIIPNIAGIFNLPDSETIHSVASIPVQVYDMPVKVVGGLVEGRDTNNHSSSIRRVAMTSSSRLTRGIHHAGLTVTDVFTARDFFI
jgi:hypothetical protein